MTLPEKGQRWKRRRAYTRRYPAGQVCRVVSVRQGRHSIMVTYVFGINRNVVGIDYFLERFEPEESS